MVLIRKLFSVYNPETKKSVQKHISGNTLEEIDKKGAEWVLETRKLLAERKEKKDTTPLILPPVPLKNEFPARDFRLEMPDDTFSLMCIGSTRSGKTTAIQHILAEYAKKHICVCFSPSTQAEIYKSFPKDTIISPLYFPEILKDMYTINSKTKNHYPFLACLDDIVDKKNDKELMKLLTIYRNSRISCLIVAQSSSIMNASGRTNINFVCLFKLNSDEEIEKVIKKYLISRYPTGMKMADKIRFYRQATEDHHFFFIDNFTGKVCLTKIST
jgi:hypothetical protein